MKKMNFRILCLRRKIVLPLFLLIGLFMFSATTMVAQEYKPMDESRIILKSELSLLLKNGVKAADASVSAPAQSTDLTAEFEYFNYLKSAFKSGDVEVAIRETYSRMKEKFPESPMKEAIFKTHQKAMSLFTY